MDESCEFGRLADEAVDGWLELSVVVVVLMLDTATEEATEVAELNGADDVIDSDVVEVFDETIGGGSINGEHGSADIRSLAT